jgi:peroxiredoxin
MSPTIQEQSDQLQAASAGRIPAEVVEIFTRDRVALRERGKPTNAVSAGDLLQDFTLPDATGEDVSLSQLVADGPAVLVFYRGGWCPYCNLALHQYQAELVPRLSRFNARMAAISPQTPDESLSTAEKHALQFSVLSDASARVARQLGVTFQPRGRVRGPTGARPRHSRRQRGGRDRTADADRPRRRSRPGRAVRRRAPGLHQPHRGPSHHLGTRRALARSCG